MTLLDKLLPPKPAVQPLALVDRLVHLTDRQKADLGGTVRECCSARGPIRDKKTETIQAAPPEAEAQEKARAIVADYVKKGQARVVIRSGEVQVRHSLQGHRLSADEFEGVTDAMAMFCAVFPDKMTDFYSSAITAHYAENVTLVLSKSEKRARLRELDDQLLQLEHVEAAAIFECLKAGLNVDLRPDMDVRALLGIEGPTPDRRDR